MLELEMRRRVRTVDEEMRHVRTTYMYEDTCSDCR